MIFVGLSASHVEFRFLGVPGNCQDSGPAGQRVSRCLAGEP